MTESPLCPKCGSTMETGFILDKAHVDRLTVSEWMEGQPEPSFWMGLAGLDAKNRTRLPVTTYRCAVCGFLESYAGRA